MAPSNMLCTAQATTKTTMLQISKCIAQGKGLAPVLIKRVATVDLDWDVRQKSRFDATDSQGRSLGIFLPRGTVVRGGDVLVADDGSFIRACTGWRWTCAAWRRRLSLWRRALN
jgi:hypothetical protein